MLSRLEPYAYALFRFVFGFLLFFHGIQKLFGVLGGRQADLVSLRGVAGILETVGGPLVAIGWFTSPTAFILSGLTAVAYFMVHQPRDLWPIQNDGENAALFSFAFLLIATRGAGAWSMDGGGRRRR
jgi:putative oxidoreductase